MVSGAEPEGGNMSPNDDPCKAAKDAYDEAQRDYDKAWQNELNIELQKWGSGVGAVGGGVGTAACFTALEAVTFGLATAGCVGLAAASGGAGVAFAGYLGTEEEAETAREDAETWKDEMEEAYCYCREHGGFEGPSVPDSPEIPDISPPEPYEDEDLLDYPFNEPSECCGNGG